MNRVMRIETEMTIPFKTEILIPPDWYYYEKYLAEFLQLYLSFLQEYATFCYMWTIYYINTKNYWK